MKAGVVGGVTYEANPPRERPELCLTLTYFMARYKCLYRALWCDVTICHIWSYCAVLSTGVW